MKHTPDPNPVAKTAGPGLNLFLGLVTLLGTMSSGIAADPVAETRRVLEFRQVTEARLPYLVQFPEGYGDDPDRRWPVLLFLHGAGERGDDLEKVTVHGPPKRRREGADLPFIIVSPQCPAGERWSEASLLALLDEVLDAHRADRSRVYLTGLSMGGYGSWALAARYPDRFAAVAPICGGGQTIDVLLGPGRSPRIRELPLWAFHGSADTVVPLEESERMVAAFKRIGNTGIRLTVYPGVQHDSWTETYANPELYAWFLKHRLP